MKPSFLLSSKAGSVFMVVCLSAILLVTSCGKKYEPTPEPVGDVHMQYVNAVRLSEPQDFYVNGAKKSTTAVAYGNASTYLTFGSGNITFGFYNEGTTTANVTSPAYGLPIGINGTVIYCKKQDGSKDVFVLPDDMSVPTAGKAKVRFINLNAFSGLNAITVAEVGASEAFIPSLMFYDTLKQYPPYDMFDQDAKFKFTLGGVSVEFDSKIVAGKSYTIWIDAASNDPATMIGHAILQN